MNDNVLYFANKNCLYSYNIIDQKITNKVVLNIKGNISFINIFFNEYLLIGCDEGLLFKYIISENLLL